MLQLFRTNQPLVAILLLAYAILLRAHNFIFPTNWQPTDPDIFSQMVYSWVGTNGFGANFLALLLVFIQALVLNAVVNNYKMTKQASYYPGLAYIFVASCLPEFLELHPIHFANTFLILVLLELFSSYKKHIAASEVFNVGFFIAIGSLFYFSANSFLLLAFIGLATIRSFNFKEISIILIGYFVPFFLLGTFLFWEDRFNEFIPVIGDFSFFNIYFASSWYNYAKLGLIIFLVLWAFFKYQPLLFKTNIQVQKNIGVVYWALVVGGISFIYQSHVDLGHTLILAVPLAICFGFGLLKIKNKAVADFWHLILLALVLILQYQAYLIGLITG